MAAGQSRGSCAARPQHPVCRGRTRRPADAHRALCAAGRLRAAAAGHSQGSVDQDSVLDRRAPRRRNDKAVDELWALRFPDGAVDVQQTRERAAIYAVSCWDALSANCRVRRRRQGHTQDTDEHRRRAARAYGKHEDPKIEESKTEDHAAGLAVAGLWLPSAAI